MFLWIVIAFVIIRIAALLIIKLTVNTKDHPDSGLGILKHPSEFKNPDIEMVDENLKSNFTPQSKDLRN